VDRDDRDRLVALGVPHDEFVHGRMIGMKQRRRAEGAVLAGEGAIAGHGNAVALGRNRGGIVERPVAIDHEARIAGEGERRIEAPGEPPRHFGGADVPADVLGEPLLRKAEPVERARHAVAGVIADEHQRRAAGGIVDLEGRRLVGSEKRFGLVARGHGSHLAARCGSKPARRPTITRAARPV